MDDGRCAEFDSPDNLQNDGGIFAELVEKEKRDQLDAQRRAAEYDRRGPIEVKSQYHQYLHI